MAASYPASLPTKDAAGANLSTNPHSALHDDLADEVVAIATELGTNPKGTSASVRARLDTHGNKLNGIVSGKAFGTSNADGDLTISFGVTFASAPVVVFTMRRASTLQVSAHLPLDPTTTGCVARCMTGDSAPLASVAVVVNWVAIGTLA